MWVIFGLSGWTNCVAKNKTCVLEWLNVEKKFKTLSHENNT